MRKPQAGVCGLLTLRLFDKSPFLFLNVMSSGLPDTPDHNQNTDRGGTTRRSRRSLLRFHVF